MQTASHVNAIDSTSAGEASSDPAGAKAAIPATTASSSGKHNKRFVEPERNGCAPQKLDHQLI